ncbi:MAG: hypothetical protein D4R68_01270 [Ignavibacteriales bacterium]|nr:MAG: hypothetical protein D4R68_01270 [Ignavibacteriales bacterium]
MKQIIHILKYKLISYIRLGSRFTFGYLVKNIGSGLIYFAFAVGAFFFSQNLIRFLLVDINVGLFLLHEFISMILFIFFMSVNLGNIIVSYSTLYKSDEVNFLLTKPILPSKIFFLKFLDNFFYSSSTLIMVLLSMLAGYVVYFKINAIGFLLLLLNFFPFMFSAGSLGVIILLIIIRFANRFSMRKVFAAIGVSYFMIILLFFKINSPLSLVSSIMKHYPFYDRDTYFGEFLPPIVKWLPNNWLSQSAYRIIKNDISGLIGFTYLQIVLSLLLFSIAFYLGHKWYFKTWLLNSKITADQNANRKISKPFFAFEKISILKSQTESIIKRDLLLFLREPSQVIHSIVLLFLIVIFILSVSGMKFVGFGNFYLQTIIYLSVFLFNLFFISTLSLRFIFPLISLEGLAYWKLKSAPVKVNSFIKNKLIVLSSIILIIGTGLSLFSNYKFGFLLTIFSLTVTLFASAAIISINFGMGGIFSNYKEKNAIRLSSSQGATLSFLSNIVYMLFLIILLFKPVSQLFLSIMIKEYFDLTVFLQALIPIIIISIIIIYTYLKIAYRSLQKDF